MHVGIIAANNLRFSPYIFYYSKILDELDMDYDIIAPNRNEILKETSNENIYLLKWDSSMHSLINYLYYSFQVRKITRKRKYDLIVALTTTCAVFCYPWMKKHRYIVDIRDYTFENNIIFYQIEKKVVANSVLNVSSSRKFETFLPEAEYLIAHNIGTPGQKSNNSFIAKEGRIRIGYIGAIAYPSQCKAVIDLVANDPRFEFHFYGTGVSEKEIQAYAEQKKCDRIKLFGGYTQDQKADIIQKVDILFNAYGSGRPLVDFALSNKMYDAMYYHKPLLTSPDTYMSELGGYMAFPFDPNVDISLDGLWNWYENLSPEQVNQYADQLYAEFLKENAFTHEKIYKVFESLLKESEI